MRLGTRGFRSCQCFDRKGKRKGGKSRPEGEDLFLMIDSYEGCAVLTIFVSSSPARLNKWRKSRGVSDPSVVGLSSCRIEMGTGKAGRPLI